MSSPPSQPPTGAGAGGAPGGPPQGGGGDPGLHTLTLEHMDYGLLIFYGSLFLLFIPILARFFQTHTGRWRQGWTLRSGYDRAERAEPLSERSLFLHARYLYNATLLRDIPYLNITIGQACVCAVYAGFIVWGLLANGGFEQLKQESPKRYGVVSVAQLPFVILFASKNTVASFIGKGYEKLNLLHRWGGLLIIVCGLLHAGFYLKIVKDNYSFSNPTYGSGTVAGVALAWIWLTSLRPVRTYAYQVFLYCHIIGWISFLVAVNYHVEFVRNLTYAVLAIYGFDLLSRVIKTRIHTAKVVALPGDMTKIEIPAIGDGWRAGQHVWIRTLNLRLLESHPFTIANAPSSCSPFRGKQALELLVKSAGDFTAHLNRLASPLTRSGKENDMSLPIHIQNLPSASLLRTASGGMHDYGFEKKEKSGMTATIVPVSVSRVNTMRGQGQDVKVMVHGPYGGLMYNDPAEKESVLIAVGGSGISFGVSVLEDLVHQIERGAARTRNVVFVWTVKHQSAIAWVQDRLSGLGQIAKTSAHLDLKIEIYVTGPTNAPYATLECANIYSSRPNLDKILNELVSDTIYPDIPRSGGVLVAVCGPQGLVSGAKYAVRSVNKGRFLKAGGVTFHSETFGW
ncbi:hypothetical protein BT69DRAFT_1333932 [Atractiella rhizophila]|nr:hypothetical protein BT69DRAFT_1333932 [Atractiella rhizophila]